MSHDLLLLHRHVLLTLGVAVLSVVGVVVSISRVGWGEDRGCRCVTILVAGHGGGRGGGVDKCHFLFYVGQ